jgi:hypothetical protein
MDLFTHKFLVQAAYRWVLKNASCGVALKELVTNNDSGEIPDVIGFGAWGHSVLIECKVSRNDFLADSKKKFRKTPETGMGKFRYYCCPTGLIKQEELPEGWGLIYVNNKGKASVRYKPVIGQIGWGGSGQPHNTLAEMQMMYSALRRLCLKGHIDSIYDKDYSNAGMDVAPALPATTQGELINPFF